MWGLLLQLLSNDITYIYGLLLQLPSNNIKNTACKVWCVYAFMHDTWYKKHCRQSNTMIDSS